MSKQEFKQVLQNTGFVKCNFGPDDDACDSCKENKKQLYSRGSDASSQGCVYYCKQCILKEYNENVGVINYG